MNNRGFRKTFENIRNHKNMKIAKSQEKYVKYMMKPNFMMGTYF